MNKRGISEIVSYTMLILISVALSVLLFAYLKLYVPKDRPQCTNQLDLIIEAMQCNNVAGGPNKLSLTLQNRGLFKADVAFIRIGKPNRSFKADIPLTNPISINNGTTTGLLPGDSTLSLQFDLPTDYSAIGNYTIEIQPAYYTKDRDPESLALCIPITQSINCK